MPLWQWKQHQLQCLHVQSRRDRKQDCQIRLPTCQLHEGGELAVVHLQLCQHVLQVVCRQDCTASAGAWCCCTGDCDRLGLASTANRTRAPARRQGTAGICGMQLGAQQSPRPPLLILPSLSASMKLKAARSLASESTFWCAAADATNAIQSTCADTPTCPK